MKGWLGVGIAHLFNNVWEQRKTMIELWDVKGQQFFHSTLSVVVSYSVDKLNVTDQPPCQPDELKPTNS